MELIRVVRVITVRLKITVRNQTSGELLGEEIECARTSADRRRGLLGRLKLEPGEGLWIDRCEGVHSFFMKFPIDVLYLDRQKRVKKIRPAMKPWRISLSLTSFSVLEVPAGTAASTRTHPGDQLSFTRVGVFAIAAALFLTSCAKHQITAAPPVSSFDRQIRNAVDAGDGDYQLARLREKVIGSPSDLDFRLDLGAAYEAKGYPELALDHYRIATEKFPDAAEPQLRLARTLVAVHHEKSGILGYSAFLASHPEAAPSYVAWLGIMQDGTGDTKASEAAHREALARADARQQDRDYLHNNLGFCLLSQGKTAEAAQEFRAALKLNPSSEIARDNLAASLAANPSEAIVHFQSVSEPAAAHNNLAALLIEQGKYPEARNEIERSLSYNRDYPAAIRNLKLVSDLDGKAATISLPPAQLPRATRVKIALHRFFQGAPVAAPATDSAVQTASRSTEVHP